MNPEPGTSLPTTLRHTRDVALQRQVAKAETAEPELPHESARPAAQMAAVAQPDLELRCLRFFRDLGGRGHGYLLFNARGVPPPLALTRRPGVAGLPSG